jgi:hypothetical protein
MSYCITNVLLILDLQLILSERKQPTTLLPTSTVAITTSRSSRSISIISNKDNTNRYWPSASEVRRVSRLTSGSNPALECGYVAYWTVWHLEHELRTQSYNISHKYKQILLMGPWVDSSQFRQWITHAFKFSLLQIQRSRDRFLALPDFLMRSGSGTESTQPRERALVSIAEKLLESYLKNKM